MYSEDNLLPVSALQHMVFCRRRAALALIEGLWEENVFTMEGRHLHKRAHEAETEVRGDIRIVRGLRLRSLKLGLVGVADVVEFHREQVVRATPTAPETEYLPMAVPLPGLKRLWRPFPVEYKRGVLKHDTSFEVQLCAQALCLGEMLGARIEAGALFYGKSARRKEVLFNDTLRNLTIHTAVEMHALFEENKTPPAVYQHKCDFCSFLFRCMPKVAGEGKSAERYLKAMWQKLDKECHENNEHT